MRPFEILLLGILAACCGLLAGPERTRRRGFEIAVGAAAVVAGLQLAVERFRWQMALAYLLVAALLLVADRRIRRPRLVAAGSGFLLLAASASAILFPHFELPAPSGPHAVGRTDRTLVDEDRPETFTVDPADRRTLAVRIWYPARAPSGARPVSYGENAREIGRVLTRGTPLPAFVFDSLALIPTHAFHDAPLPGGDERYPVLIFSHAYFAGLSQSTVLMEELASHGYVVASVAHAFETPCMPADDGGIVAFDPRNEEFRLRGEERRRTLDLERELIRTQDPRMIERLLRRIFEARPKTLESLAIWCADIRFVVDEMERWNEGDGMFAGRLDTARLGVLGHSFGGTAAGETCLQDPRFRAGINFDGLQLGSMLDRNLTRPFLFVHHDNPAVRGATPNRWAFEGAESAAYLLVVRGTRHLDFSDLCLWGRASLIRLTGALGSLEGRRSLRIQCDYALAFFDTHLRGSDSPLLEGPSEAYPEVAIEIRRP